MGYLILALQFLEIIAFTQAFQCYQFTCHEQWGSGSLDNIGKGIRRRCTDWYKNAKNETYLKQSFSKDGCNGCYSSFMVLGTSEGKKVIETRKCAGIRELNVLLKDGAKEDECSVIHTSPGNQLDIIKNYTGSDKYECGVFEVCICTGDHCNIKDPDLIYGESCTKRAGPQPGIPNRDKNNGAGGTHFRHSYVWILSFGLMIVLIGL